MRQLLGAASGVANAARLEDIPVSGNPSGLIGLSVNNGVAGTWARTDATHALDVTISPVWSGPHQFSALLKANLGLTVAGAAFTSRGITDAALATALAISTAGNLTVNSPTSTTSTVGGYAFNVKGPTTTGASYGLLITAGTNASDLALQVLNAAVSADLFAVFGNGAVALPSVATTTTAPATGTAGALPAKPKGYFSISIAGYAAQVPYY